MNVFVDTPKHCSRPKNEVHNTVFSDNSLPSGPDIPPQLLYKIPDIFRFLWLSTQWQKWHNHIVFSQDTVQLQSTEK